MIACIVCHEEVDSSTNICCRPSSLSQTLLLSICNFVEPRRTVGAISSLTAIVVLTSELLLVSLGRTTMSVHQARITEVKKIQNHTRRERNFCIMKMKNNDEL
mgnify:FL=1